MHPTNRLLSVGVAFPLSFAAASGLGAAGKLDPYPPAAGPFRTLAADGKAQCRLVLPETPSEVETHAGEELRKYLKAIAGADVPVGAAAPAAGLAIYLGAPARERLTGVDWAALGDDGFVLRSNEGGLHICGATELGTLFGVYQFLEKHCGVRWFLPGELGEVVPEAATLRVGTFDEIVTPAFRIRWIDRGEWALRNRMNVDVTVAGKPVGVNWKWGFHTHFRLVPPQKYYDEHPDWFAADGNGVRPRPKPKKQGQQLCTSNSALIEEMAKNVIKMFDEQPEIDILALAPQDGGGFCVCENCLALDEKRPPDEQWHARYSKRLATFNNAVAKRVAQKHPDKLIKVGAYAMYLRVPKDPGYKPEPNLAVQACHTYACNNHPIESPACKGNTKYFRAELEHWARITDHLFIYEYYNKGAMGCLPYWQIHVIAEDIPYYHRLGAESFYTQASRGNAFCFLNHYVAMKLTWNVSLDTGKLVDDFCEKFFGSAGAAMRRYFTTLERAYVEWDQELSPFGLRWVTLIAPEIFNPAILAGMEEALRQAESTEAPDVVTKRIRLFRLNFEYAKRTVHYLAAVRKPFDGVDLADAEAVAAARKKARETGEPLAKELKSFCKQNRIPYPARRIEVHNRDLRYIIDVPDRKPILM